jgi:membrane dipeptidase
MKVSIAACVIALMGGSVAMGDTIAARAARIHREAIVLDTHSDTTPSFENPEWDFAARHTEGHVDIPRLREGGYDAVFWAIYMGKTPGDGKAIKTALRRIDSVHEIVRRHPQDLVLATRARDVKKAARDGKIACLMGIEGGHVIENDLGALRMFYALGVRYMTLTHSFNIEWADSSGTGETIAAEHDGLTDFGRDVVREMNRLGMMVDVSHVADSTFWDVIETTKAPIIASHSSCRALADHPRNMSDEMIRALAKNGGVVQINFYPGYIDPKRVELLGRLRPEFDEIAKKFADEHLKLTAARRDLFKRAIAEAGGPSPARWVVDHIEHVIKLVGDDYAGLGADWDGVPEMPQGLEDVSKVPSITEELLRRGYSEKTIKKVMGGNVLRVMAAVEKAGQK